jgi:hypothetical protein
MPGVLQLPVQQHFCACPTGERAGRACGQHKGGRRVGDGGQLQEAQTSPELSAIRGSREGGDKAENFPGNSIPLWLWKCHVFFLETCPKMFQGRVGQVDGAPVPPSVVTEACL